MKGFQFPGYAGIITVDKSGTVKTVKAGKRLHTKKASERDIAYLNRGLMFRYWGNRIES